MSIMNHRLAIFVFTAAGIGCSSSGSPDSSNDRFPSLEYGADCADLALPSPSSVATVAGPLRSSFPGAILAEADGAWFTDAQNLSVNHVSPDGTLRRLAAPFPSEAAFDAAIGEDDNIWFDIMTADRVMRIGRMTRDGETALFEIPSGMAARRLARGPDGAVWFTAGNNVGRIGTDGTIEEIPVGAKTGDITSGANDAVWFTEPDANRVGRLALDGALEHFELGTTNVGLGAIALGPDGNVWFTETNAGKIGRISEDGAIQEFDAVSAPAKLRELTAGPDGRLWFTLSTGDAQTARVGVMSISGCVGFLDLARVQNSVDFRPGVDMLPVPNGITSGDDELWMTARLEPFETGVVLRVDLSDQGH
jgi:virginiamycin B lyase